MTHIIANFKAHNSLHEMQSWLDTFTSYNLDILGSENTLILCPPFPFLSLFSTTLHHPRIFIGAQDVSQFAEGSYTGDVPAHSLQGIATHVLIGHSERRTHHNETQEQCALKHQQAIEGGLTPIFLVRGAEDSIPSNTRIVAYEPVEAIGSGNSMSPDEVLAKKSSLQLGEGCLYLYGGSVTSENARSYTTTEGIDGVLVGKSSLDPAELYAIMTQSVS